MNICEHCERIIKEWIADGEPREEAEEFVKDRHYNCENNRWFHCMSIDEDGYPTDCGCGNGPCPHCGG